MSGRGFAIVAMTAALAGGCGGPGPEETVDEFLSAWAREDYASACDRLSIAGIQRYAYAAADGELPPPREVGLSRYQNRRDDLAIRYKDDCPAGLAALGPEVAREDVDSAVTAVEDPDEDSPETFVVETETNSWELTESDDGWRITGVDSIPKAR